jgi:hypothetical protein
MPVEIEAQPAPKLAGSRGMSFLLGAAVAAVLLFAASAVLSGRPSGSIVGPNEAAGSATSVRR